MKISTVTKALVIPTIFFIPFVVSKGDERTQSQVRNSITRDINVPVLPRPLILAQIDANKKEELNAPKFEIVETITNSKSIDTKKYSAYYKVDIKNKGWFYIVQNKDCKTNNVFDLAFDREEKAKGLLFPKPEDSSKPVAVIGGNGAKLSGVFKVYDTGDSYEVKYDISPLVTVATHTNIDSRFLLNVDETIKNMPQSMISDLIARGVEVYLTRNIEDSFYHLYPSWKEYDRNHPNDPNKPWFEYSADGNCKDNRNYSNTSALYKDKRAIIPQTHYEYGTRKTIDRIHYPIWTKHTVGHELGHAADAYDNDDYYFGVDSSSYKAKKKGFGLDWYSYLDEFKTAFEIDKSRMSPELKEKLGYSWCRGTNGQVEGFANLFSCFMDTEAKEDAALLLSAFPNASEHMRKKFLPKFGVNLTIEDVRKNIYPEYLKAEKALTKNEKEARRIRMFQLFVDHPANLPRLEISCCGNK